MPIEPIPCRERELYGQGVACREGFPIERGLILHEVLRDRRPRPRVFLEAKLVLLAAQVCTFEADCLDCIGAARPIGLGPCGDARTHREKHQKTLTRSACRIGAPRHIPSTTQRIDDEAAFAAVRGLRGRVAVGARERVACAESTGEREIIDRYPRRGIESVHSPKLISHVNSGAVEHGIIGDRLPELPVSRREGAAIDCVKSSHRGKACLVYFVQALDRVGVAVGEPPSACPIGYKSAPGGGLRDLVLQCTRQVIPAQQPMASEA